MTEVEEAEPVVTWTVVDSVDSLNVRAEATTSAEIVATLRPGDSGLIGTGETAKADGLDWIQLAASEDRPVGWVAAEFLEAEDATADTG